jgi:hypothetical protein
MKAKYLLAAVCLVVGIFGSSASAEDLNAVLPFKDVELPKDIALVPADASVPPASAAFVGLWAGKWNSGIENVLVVKSVDKDKAIVIYAWGPSPKNGLPTNGFVEYTAGFIDEKTIKFTSKLGATVKYKISDDGKELKASYSTSEFEMAGRLSKVK